MKASLYKNVLREVAAGIVEVIFPSRCFACQELLPAPGSLGFCVTCLAGVKLIASPLCPVCGLPFPAGTDHSCGECLLSPPSYHLARAYARYEGTFLEAIHKFKYQGEAKWGKILGQEMAQAVYPGLCFADYSLILPVPLHRRRLRERGYNQSLLLAREIAQSWHLELSFTLLVRKVDTPRQTELDREKRQKNVRGAFHLADPAQVEGKNVLLVDDVYTTGSTVKECSLILRRAGAGQVAVLTAARAV